MPLDTSRFETPRRSSWPWRAGLVVDDAALAGEIAAALNEARATCVFHISASAPAAEIHAHIERDRPDLLFVELAAISAPSRDWMKSVQGADGLPLVAAVHTRQDPEQMIAALRAGASEFLSLPVQPAIFDVLDRIASRLESSRSPDAVQGRIIGIVSAKGGCGATTLACHVSLALSEASPSRKILLADLDYQSPAVHRMCHIKGGRRAGETFDSVRKLSSSNWAEFFPALTPAIDVMTGPEAGGTPPPEAWRIESLFRHLTRSYSIVLADLGRHLNPVTWAFLQHVDELLVVVVPDVLALYQTRYILQTLTGRGFERSRIRLVLNLSEKTPRDFWIESIEQMFEMRIFAVVAADKPALAALPADRLSFPAETPFGKSVRKLADRLSGSEDSGSTRRAA